MLKWGANASMEDADRDMDIAQNLRELYGDSAGFTYLWAMDYSDMTNHFVALALSSNVPSGSTVGMIERMTDSLANAVLVMMRDNNHVAEVVGMITAEAKRRQDTFIKGIRGSL